MAVQHGFGASEVLRIYKLLWPVLAVLLGCSAPGMSFQVNEVVDEEVAAMTEDVKKIMVPLNNFLLADSDLSKVILSTSSPEAAKISVDQGLYLGLSRRMLISKMVDWEDARLGMRMILDEVAEGLHQMALNFREKEARLNSTLVSQDQEVKRLQKSVDALLVDIEVREKKEKERQSTADREKEALEKALDAAYAKLANWTVDSRSGTSTATPSPSPLLSDPSTAARKDDAVKAAESVEESSTLGLLVNCTTVQCGIGRLSEFAFSFTWTMLTDPLSFTVNIWTRGEELHR